MTTRAGGVSDPPFDSFNLGSHVRDRAEAVAQNRDRLVRHLGARPVFLEQVHGIHCVQLDKATPDGTVADACTTREVGVACTVMVADCLPVLLTDECGNQVAAVHAGWRGLAGAGAREGGVLEQALKQFDQPSRVLAWLGPCIGPAAFEVGDEVRHAFCSQARDVMASEACFQPAGRAGKFFCDLAALARLRLSAGGITHVYGNDGASKWCTATQVATWFSHRRDAAVLGSTGRMAACIWRVG